MAIIQTIPLGKKYGSMTSSEAQEGTNTESQLISAKVLNDQIDEKISDIGLATVATSGSYNDLNDKPTIPTIPTVNNGTLTIQKNGTTVKTFSANASSNVTANITVPTKTSDLTNDSDYATRTNVADSLQEAKNYVGTTTSNFVTTDTTQTIIGTKTFSKTIVGNINGNAETATKATQDASGNVITTTYATKNELSGKQNKLTTTQLNAVNSDITSTKVNSYDNYATEISAKANASDLALTNTNLGAHTNNSAIHVTSTERSNWNAKSNFSGSYTDLTNKPTIPTVNNATLTIQKNGTTVKTFSANASANTTANITVPTKTSDLTNDSDYATRTNVADSLQQAKNYTGSAVANCVNLTGTQTITGAKSFTYNVINKITTYAVTDTPTSNLYKQYFFLDKDDTSLGFLQYASRTTGVRDLSLYVNDKDRNVHGIQINTNKEFKPIANNTYFLGASNAWWKSAYINSMNSANITLSDANFLRCTYGSYGTFWRQDGNNLYLMLTNKDDQYGTWNSFRPITVSLSTGVCNINGNINGNAATATKATRDASGNVITNTYATKTALSSGTNNGSASNGVGSLILGCVSRNDMASAESAAHSNSFLNISGSVIKLASLSMVSSSDVFAINRDSSTLPGTWRFLGYSKQPSNSLYTLGLFIRIA